MCVCICRPKAPKKKQRKGNFFKILIRMHVHAPPPFRLHLTRLGEEKKKSTFSSLVFSSNQPCQPNQPISKERRGEGKQFDPNHIFPSRPKTTLQNECMTSRPDNRRIKIQSLRINPRLLL